MRFSRHISLLGMSATAGLSVSASSAQAQLDTALISADVTCATLLDDGAKTRTDQQGGHFESFYPMLANAFDSVLGKPGAASSSAAQDTMLTATSISSTGLASADTDQERGVDAAMAQAAATLRIAFTLENPRGWRFAHGVVRAQQAQCSVSLTRLLDKDQQTGVFAFSGEFGGAHGTLDAGEYILTASAFALSDITDGLGGLSASAAWAFQFDLLEAPALCAGDADGNGFIEFADATSVLQNYRAFYGAASGPGDADASGEVNYADLTSVLLNFGNACE